MTPTCACAHANEPAPTERATSIGADCFEVRHIDRLAAFDLGADFSVPAAGLVAILPAKIELARAPGSLSTPASRPIRAGPRSPIAAQAKLMVFLT